MRTLAVDFDGVLHSYTSGWKGAVEIPDPPTDGAIEFLQAMRKHYRVVVFTTRAETPAGVIAVRDYLHQHGYPISLSDITYTKPPAVVYLDDRALRFDGTFPTLEQIREATIPWNAEPPELPAEEREAIQQQLGDA